MTDDDTSPLLYGAAVSSGPYMPPHPRALLAGEMVIARDDVLTNAGSAVASGVLSLSYFTAIKTETISQVALATSTTAAAATPSLIRIGIYELNPSTLAGTLVASTPNDTTLFVAASTMYTKALSAPFIKKAGTRYAVGILIVSGVALPTLLGLAFSAASSADLGREPKLAATVTSQADLPATIAASAAAAGRRFQTALLP